MSVGKRIDKITRRFRRILKTKAPDPPKMSVSQIIRPEEIVRPYGKRAPKTTRKVRQFESQDGLTVEVLPGGIVHVRFDTSSIRCGRIAVRDPVTRRLARRQLDDGMRRTTGFYDKTGDLFGESKTNW